MKFQNPAKLYYTLTLHYTLYDFKKIKIILLYYNTSLLQGRRTKSIDSSGIKPSPFYASSDF